MATFNFVNGSTINTFVPGVDIISFPAGASAQSLSFGQTGSNLVIYSALGSVTVANLSASQLVTGSLSFADGSLFLVGTALGDTLTGGVGSDNLDGLAGNDSMTGGNGNDKLFGDNGNDTLVGGTGYDELYGGDGNDVLDASAGGSTTEGGGDSIRPGSGSNTIIGNASIFAANEGILISYQDVTGSGGLQIAVGANGTGTVTSTNAGVVNDTFTYAYWFIGTSDTDRMTGSANANYEGWHGLAGNDTLDGGSGWDEVRYDKDYALGGTSGVNVNLQTGVATDGFGNTDTLSNMDAIRGTRLADVFTSSSAIGFQSFRPLAGNDTIIGSSATDRLDYARDSSFGGNAGVVVNLATGTAIDGFGNTDTLSDIDWVIGTSQADSITGSAGSNNLRGQAGNDSLYGGDGGDSLYGENGNDTVDGGAGDDYLFGGAGADSVLGGLGNDYIQGADGANDTLDGGDGSDIVAYDFEDSDTPVNFTATGGSEQSDGLGGTDTLLNIEEIHIYGGSAGDVLVGDARRNYLLGNGGNDTLTGGTGNDIFSFDIAQVNGVDRITDFSADDNLDFQDLVLTSLSGSGNASTLGQGAVLVGAPTAGITTLYVGTDATAGADLTIELQGNYAASDFSYRNYTGGASVNYTAGQVITGTPDNDTLNGGMGADTIDGLAGDDHLYGNSGADSIQGGLGNDYMQGGVDGANDTIDGGDGNDIVGYGFGGNTPVNFTASGGSTQSDGLGGIDTLLNIEEIHIYGGSAGDVLVGDARGNYIAGNGGNDTIDGGAGTDTAAYSSNLANFTVTKTGNTYTVTDKTGSNGTDTLTNIETLRFGDLSVNLQIQSLAASAQPAEVARISELYVAFFNRTPDADGLAYWISAYAAGQSISEISESFYYVGASPEYASLTGFSTSMTNEDFIHVFYKNVLGRPEGADAGGLAYWNAKLISGESTRSSLANDILGFAHTFKGDADWGWVADLLDNKIAVANKIAVEWGLTYNTNAYQQGVAIAAAITPTDTSAALALVGIAGVDITLS